MNTAEKFNLVFEGKLAPGKATDDVKQALMKLLKTDAKRDFIRPL